MRKISAYGETKLAQWEGEVLHTYDDFDPKHMPIKPGAVIRGTPTIGVGHTGPDVQPGKKITVVQSRALLRQDVAKFERLVERLIEVPLDDNQFDALVLFSFNIGETAFTKSTLVKVLNAGDYDAVPAELMRWTKSKGKQMKGLVTRRSNEIALWNRGKTATVPVSVQPAIDNPWTKPETVLTIAGGAGTAATTVAASGMDPIRLAIAVAIVALTALVAFFIYKRIRQVA